MTLFDEPGPDLTSYDVILVNTSGGKDSQVTLDEVVRKADAAGVPKSRIVAVHADLGRVEWPGTPELAEEQVAHYGLRFIKVTREQNDLLDHARERKMWPSSAARWCTSDHKRGPVRRVMTALAAEQRAAGVTDRRVRILNVMGFRAQESAARRKRIPFEVEGKASNKTVRQVDEWLPVHDWLVEQVWERIRETGIRHHWAYDLGMPRLSCAFCVLAPASALVTAARALPDLAAEYVDVEVQIGHRFTEKLSMAEVVERAVNEPAPAIVENWSA